MATPQTKQSASISAENQKAALHTADGQGRDSGLVNKLGEVKDAIGEWHDWTELAAIATEILDHRPACNLIRQIRSTTDTKLDRALSLAVRMRSKYLGIGFGMGIEPSRSSRSEHMA